MSQSASYLSLSQRITPAKESAKNASIVATKIRSIMACFPSKCLNVHETGCRPSHTNQVTVCTIRMPLSRRCGVLRFRCKPLWLQRSSYFFGSVCTRASSTKRRYAERHWDAVKAEEMSVRNALAHDWMPRTDSGQSNRNGSRYVLMLSAN